MIIIAIHPSAHKFPVRCVLQIVRKIDRKRQMLCQDFVRVNPSRVREGSEGEVELDDVAWQPFTAGISVLPTP
tara:strand:+ start:52 stop:270 length:219 start_codon:yes stop_codon:yes gene_type:complete